MADDTKRGPHIAARLNVKENCEVTRWTGKFGASGQRLRDAISRVSVDSGTVKCELRG